MSKFIVKTVDFVFYILIGIILVASISSLCGMVSDGFIGYVLFMGLLLFVFAVWYFGEDILNFVYKKIYTPINKVSVFKMMFCVFLVSFVTKVFFVFLFDNDAANTIDMSLYASFSQQLSDNGKITEHLISALNYPYQVIYGLFLSPVVSVFGKDTKALTVFLSLLLSISSVLLFDIIRKYVGKTTAFIGIMLYNLLPVGLFQSQLLIHETPLLFFHITSLWLFLKYYDKKYNLPIRISFLILSAILISFANKINQGGTIVIISFCIFCVAKTFIDKVNVKKIISVLFQILCFGLCFIVMSNVCNSFVKNVVSENSEATKKIEYRLPMGWAVYLGFNYETSGHWNEADANTYEKYSDFDNRDDAIEYQKELIEERLQNYIDEPVIIPIHVFNKFKGLWGNPFLPFSYDDGNQINKFVLEGAGGIINKLFIIISSLSFIIVCSMILFSRRRLKNINTLEKCTPEMHFKMVIIGLTLALILFEVMPKYVSHLQIIVFAVWMFGLRSFYENSKAIKFKIRGKKI